MKKLISLLLFSALFQALVQGQTFEAAAGSAKADLDKALPAFDSAMKSLKSLSKSDLVEVRGYTKPPALVMKVMECVCILLGSKPDWDSAKKVLGDVNLMERLETFDKDHIPPKVVKEITRYYDEPDFLPEIVEKVSLACRSLCLWCRAMKVYNEVAQVVEPKKRQLAEAELQLAETAERQAQARAEVEVADRAHQDLQTQYNKAEEHKQQLQKQVQVGI